MALKAVVQDLLLLGCRLEGHGKSLVAFAGLSNVEGTESYARRPWRRALDFLSPIGVWRRGAW
jgi:hypothetical protein